MIACCISVQCRSVSYLKESKYKIHRTIILPIVFFIWVRSLASHIRGRTEIEIVSELSAEDSIFIIFGGRNRRTEKIT